MPVHKPYYPIGEAGKMRCVSSRPHDATFEDGYQAAEICDAILRSAATGSREQISYRES